MDRLRKHSSIKNWILFGSILSLGYLFSNKLVQAEISGDSENEEQKLAQVHPVDPLEPGVEITPVPHQYKNTESIVEKQTDAKIPNRSELPLPNGEVPEKIKKNDAPKYATKRFSLLKNQAVVLITNEDDEGGGGSSDEPSYISQICAGITGKMLFGVRPNYYEE